MCKLLALQSNLLSSLICNLHELIICFLAVLVIPNQSFLFQLQFLCLRDLAFYFMITILTYFPISFFFLLFSFLLFVLLIVQLACALHFSHFTVVVFHCTFTNQQSRNRHVQLKLLTYQCLVNYSCFSVFFSFENIPMKT